MHKIILLLGLCWVFSASIDAQQTVLNFPDYTKRKARCIELKDPVRRTVTDVSYVDGKPAVTKQTIYEVVRPGIVRETFSSPPVRQIVVTLEDFIYRKLDDGPWEKTEWYFRHGITESETEFLGTDKYWTESRVQDGKTFTILGSAIEQELRGKRVARRAETFVEPSGLCSKSITTYESLSPKMIVRVVTTTAEHDDTIKVEAPIQ